MPATMHGDIYGADQGEKIGCGEVIGRIIGYVIVIGIMATLAITINKKGGGDPTINSVIFVIVLVVAITLGTIAYICIKEKIDKKIEEKKRNK